MKKLTVILGMLGVFALGCATASVMVDRAKAAPVSGSHECVSFGVNHVSTKDVANGKVEERVVAIPPGWTPVGGADFGGFPSVVACRAVP